MVEAGLFDKTKYFYVFQDSAAANLPAQRILERKEEHVYFSCFFKFLCAMAVAHYLFSIAYTYVYYPTIWKNVIEGYMEVFRHDED